MIPSSCMPMGIFLMARTPLAMSFRNFRIRSVEMGEISWNFAILKWHHSGLSDPIKYYFISNPHILWRAHHKLKRINSYAISRWENTKKILSVGVQNCIAFTSDLSKISQQIRS